VLAVLPPDAPVATLRLHPVDATAPAVTDLAARGVTVVADPSLAPGDAVVDAGDQVVDLRFGPALERVERALLAAYPDPQGGAR
jgi:flagellar assembly protein FliH